MKAQTQLSPKVIATRKACKVDGIGLSHFVLMTQPAAPSQAKPKAPQPAAKP